MRPAGVFNYSPFSTLNSVEPSSSSIVQTLGVSSIGAAAGAFIGGPAGLFIGAITSTVVAEVLEPIIVKTLQKLSKVKHEPTGTEYNLTS